MPHGLAAAHEARRPCEQLGSESRQWGDEVLKASGRQGPVTGFTADRNHHATKVTKIRAGGGCLRRGDENGTLIGL